MARIRANLINLEYFLNHIILMVHLYLLLAEQLMHQNVLVDLVVFVEYTCFGIEYDVCLNVVFSVVFLDEVFVYSFVARKVLRSERTAFWYLLGAVDSHLNLVISIISGDVTLRGQSLSVT